MPNNVVIFGEAAVPLVNDCGGVLKVVAPEIDTGFNSAILNSLAAEIAVINLDGVILEVNDPWRQFAVDNSPREALAPPTPT